MAGTSVVSFFFLSPVFFFFFMFFHGSLGRADHKGELFTQTGIRYDQISVELSGGCEWGLEGLGAMYIPPFIPVHLQPRFPRPFSICSAEICLFCVPSSLLSALESLFQDINEFVESEMKGKQGQWSSIPDF